MTKRLLFSGPAHLNVARTENSAQSTFLVRCLKTRLEIKKLILCGASWQNFTFKSRPRISTVFRRSSHRLTLEYENNACRLDCSRIVAFQVAFEVAFAVCSRPFPSHGSDERCLLAQKTSRYLSAPRQRSRQNPDVYRVR
jgi:hypothetical protein